MDSGHLIFDSSSSSSRSGHMLILGGGNSIFRGPRSVLGMEESTNKRRPFFTSPEELLDEEYYDEQLPEKKRRLTPEQVHLLERSFEAENKLEPERKTELAKTLGLQPRQVAVWFQNRRARWKTKQLERDFDRLKAAYDSLLADHDSIVKDNDCLRSQVAILSEKLQTKELGAVVVSQREMMKSLSSGSGGSSVVDGNIGEGPHHLAAVDVSSDESYFHQDSCCFQGNYIDIGAPIAGSGGGGGGVRSSEEEEDGSDDGCNYNIPVGGMFRDSNQASNDDNWWGVWNP